MRRRDTPRLLAVTNGRSCDVTGRADAAAGVTRALAQRDAAMTRGARSAAPTEMLVALAALVAMLGGVLLPPEHLATAIVLGAGMGVVIAGATLAAVASRSGTRQSGAGPDELSSIVAAEEAVRGQLAAELHDTVAQSLVVARGMLAAPLDDLRLAQLRDVVQDAEEQVRALTARTRPPAFDDGDLGQAVQALCADLRVRYAFEVEVSWTAASYPLSVAAATVLYRFFGEALLNVVKHADVDHAQARLEVDGHAIVATVGDDGPGFDPERVASVGGRHVGLALLRERARLAGGSLAIASQPGRGTTLVLRLPEVAVAALPTVRLSVAAGSAAVAPTVWMPARASRDPVAPASAVALPTSTTPVSAGR